MLRVVLDPGVLVSALISPDGPPAQILDRWREGQFDLVVSERLLDELQDVLFRRKFRAFADEVDARAYVEALRGQAVLAADPADVPRLTRDPDDDYLVALARAAEVDVIVSGDAHLIELVDPDPPVLTPRELFRRLEAW